MIGDLQHCKKCGNIMVLLSKLHHCVNTDCRNYALTFKDGVEYHPKRKPDNTMFARKSYGGVIKG